MRNTTGYLFVFRQIMSRHYYQFEHSHRELHLPPGPVRRLQDPQDPALHHGLRLSLAGPHCLGRGNLSEGWIMKKTCGFCSFTKIEEMFYLDEKDTRK